MICGLDSVAQAEFPMPLAHMDDVIDTSQDDTIAMLETSIAAFLRREADPFGSGAIWPACREFGLFSLLGDGPGDSGFSLTAYARLLVSLGRMNGQLAFAVAQTNQARLLSQAFGRPQDGFEAAVLALPAPGNACANGIACFESAIPPRALDILWAAGIASCNARTPRALPAVSVDNHQLMPLAQGSACHRLGFGPDSSTRLGADVRIDEASLHYLAAKQILDGMAIAQGQLWHGYEAALAFCNERQVFNRSLLQFQSVRARLAHVYVLLRVLSAAISSVCSNVRANPAAPLIAALVAIHRRVALHAAAELMQAFGGSAFMEESGMPEVYSNVVRLSLASMWGFPMQSPVPLNGLACAAIDLANGRLAAAGSGSEWGERWCLATEQMENWPPDKLDRLLEFAGYCLAIDQLDAEDDGCGGALRAYLESETTLMDMARLRRSFLPCAATR